ncbi:VanZ family protein [Paenarthrobacter sp. CC6]|uniref:VanZ family protein n=1 Tax=Paenarthrobacter sp. CC6 TaxID=3029184 RepID=UPI00339C0850
MLNYLHAHGAPRWVDYNLVEGAANVAMFIPFGFMAGLALYPTVWWRVTGLGLLAAAGMELGQLLFLTERFSSLMDIVTNTIGTVIGVACARLMSRKTPNPVLAEVR